MARLRARTCAMSMRQLSLLIPNSQLLQKYDATFALWIIFLLGRQAMFGHEQPIYFRSITAVFIPCFARDQEVKLPATPLPRIRSSYSSPGQEGVFIARYAR